MPPALEPGLGDFFWPGDADWSGVLDKADFLVYPTAVNTAPHAGQRLADYLLMLPNLVVLNFVGHSLGCRVVLECIEAMARVNAPVIRRVVLMAAAVPTFMVQAGGVLARAVQTAQSVVVLHSADDPVLHYAFPPGQTIAGIGEGFLPVALGRFGPPPGMAGQVEEHRVAGAGHSDYWGALGDGASAAAEMARTAAAGFIADALQLATLARRVAGARKPSAATLVGVPRRTADPRNMPSRRVGWS